MAFNQRPRPHYKPLPGPRSASSNRNIILQALPAQPLDSSPYPQLLEMAQSSNSVPAIAPSNDLMISKQSQATFGGAQPVSGVTNDEGEEADEVLLQQLIWSGNMVKIYVSAEKQCWVLHENALYHYSDYFKKAFQGNFAEARHKTLSLKEEDSVLFGFS